jgi:hypothetical protein
MPELACLCARLALVLAALIMAQAEPARAEWLSKLVLLGEKAGSKAVRHGGSVLDNAAVHLKGLPAGTKGAALAADVGPEGHWTFVNRAGERFTAGTPDELSRVISVLAPEASSGAQSRLTLLLGEDAVFKHRAALKDLPKGADLRIAVGAESFPLLRRGQDAAEKLYAEVRPSLLVELGERKLFTEAMWQLNRPLSRANIRVLALEPGGPQTLSSAPKIDAASRRALTDTIDPYKLPAALRSLGGQTVILTGRIEGRFLYFRSGGGPERSLILQDLSTAAEAADVNLIVLQSATPRQPGTRNWLWQRVEVSGLDEAMKRATLADFLNALGGGQRKLVVTAREAGQGRVSLSAAPLAGESAPLSGIGDAFAEIVSDVTGNVVTSVIDADLTSSERQKELDERIITGIPSDIQFAYLGFLIIGLMGLPVARDWWLRLWPAERREEYGAAFGYHAARAARLALFVLVFMPLVGAPAFLWNLALQVWSWITFPVRAWRWLTGHRSAQAT